MTSVLSGVLMIAGAVFCLLAGVGVLRFRDTYSRMHAAAKASTLGILLVTAGALVELHSTTAIALLVLVVVLQLLTTPVGAHMLGSGIHHHGGAVSALDELADDEATTATAAAAGAAAPATDADEPGAPADGGGRA